MQALFIQLDSFLTQTQSFWRYEAFHACRLSALPWGDAYPELTAWLYALSQDEVVEFKTDPEKLSSVLSGFFRVRGDETPSRHFRLFLAFTPITKVFDKDPRT